MRGIKDLHTTIEEVPDITYPKRKYSTVDIPGASRQVILDENAYENRTINLKLSVMADNPQDRSFRIAKVVDEFSKGNYSDLVLYSDPNFRYEVISSSSIKVDKPAMSSEYTKVEISLNAGAFKYMYPEEKIVLSNELNHQNGTVSQTFITNPTSYRSAPLIIHKADSDHQEFIDSLIFTAYLQEDSADSTTQNVEFNVDLKKTSIIDCDELAQSVSYEDGTIVRNATLFDGYAVFGKSFLTLYPGTTELLTPNKNITIYPRWRTM